MHVAKLCRKKMHALRVAVNLLLLYVFVTYRISSYQKNFIFVRESSAISRDYVYSITCVYLVGLAVPVTKRWCL